MRNSAGQGRLAAPCQLYGDAVWVFHEGLAAKPVRDVLHDVADASPIKAGEHAFKVGHGQREVIEGAVRGAGILALNEMHDCAAARVEPGAAEVEARARPNGEPEHIDEESLRLRELRGGDVRVVDPRSPL